MANERDTQTEMVHFECKVCAMTATCVYTPSAALAWADHMRNHADPSLYAIWFWYVMPLPLEYR